MTLESPCCSLLTPRPLAQYLRWPYAHVLHFVHAVDSLATAILLLQNLLQPSSAECPQNFSGMNRKQTLSGLPKMRANGALTQSVLGEIWQELIKLEISEEIYFRGSA